VNEFSCDVDRCVAFDLEVYQGRWCVGFHGPDRNGKRVTLTVDADAKKLAEVLKALVDHNRILVGYNSQRFDLPIIRGILRGLDPYVLAQEIIQKGRQPSILVKLPQLDCDHIDLAARLRRGGAFPSLKAVAANLGRPLLKELPYPPDSILTDDQWDQVKIYNGIDLGHTWALLERFAPELQVLALLSNELERDLRSTPIPRVCEVFFLDAYKRKHGAKPRMPAPPLEVVYRPGVGVSRPRAPEARGWYDQVVNQPLPVLTVGGRPKVQVPQATFEIGRLQLSAGGGGLHTIDRPRVFYSTRERRLVSVDVASFYPSLIATKHISPTAYGSTGAEIYQAILDRRLEIKRHAKTVLDAADRERLDLQEKALKLVLNSAFGKFGDFYSSLFDPSALIAVTLAGQLMLIDLIERLTDGGVAVLSANTDGLFIQVPRRANRWRKILREWQRDTKMRLDVDLLKRLVILATNRFASLDVNGSIKRKGDGIKGLLSPLAAPNDLVVNDAVVAALLQDIPPERTIRECRDPIRFCRVTRRSSSVTQAVLLDEKSNTETELPKIARSYKARGSSSRILHRLGGGRHTTPAHSIGVRLAHDLSDGSLPVDLDLGWYIGQARRVFQGVPGYRHRSAKRLEGNPQALEVLGKGLLPIPKRGKALFPGSDPKSPTFLWDWDEARTVGCFTGPKVGILVLDVDDHVKFRRFVDRGNSPLFRDRWRDLDGCLVSLHGDPTGKDVRSGRARGKLIFRLAGDEQHPLARVHVNRWTKSRGVELFYGKGLPSVVGEHPSGETYRLEGTLTDAPDWLFEELTPKTTGPRAGRPRNVHQNRPLPEPSVNGHPHEERAEGEADAALEGLLQKLAEIDPKLDGSLVGWRRRELTDNRMIVIGRCPFEHKSGTSSDGDVFAGFNQDGVPYVKCRHSSCTAYRTINEALAAQYALVTSPKIEPPELTPTEMAKAMVDDLLALRVALHQGPTGSGKTFSLCQAAVMIYRLGRRPLIAVPTLRLAQEVTERLREMAPEAFQLNAVAQVYGNHRSANDGSDSEDGLSENDDGGSDEGDYPVHKGTAILICTHAGIARRGFSKFLRGLWAVLEPRKDAEHATLPFDLIIDEVGELVRQSHREIELDHRFKTSRHPDGSGSMIIPLRDCPLTNWSGNCGNCSHTPQGGEVRFGRFMTRELVPPRRIGLDKQGNHLSRPASALAIADDEFTLGEKTIVGTALFAAKVLAYRGTPVEALTWRTADLFVFSKGRDGQQPPEMIEDVLGHMLKFAHNPVISWEHPVDPDGRPIDSAAMRDRLEKIELIKEITTPHQTCEVRRLRFTDVVVLAQIRRYRERSHRGLIFAGATLTGSEFKVLQAVWPQLVTRQHPYPPRKIKQAAVVFVRGPKGRDSLVTTDNRLVTGPLEANGIGLIFLPTKRNAIGLFDAVKLNHPSARIVLENDEFGYLDGKTVHKKEDMRCLITYTRGVLGLGANIEDVRFLVIDARTFRALSSFNPGEITPAAFDSERAEERLAVILQNVGRALRGEAGKTVVLFVLNSDPILQKVIEKSPALSDGAELPSVFGHGEDLVSLVDQANRWLTAGGGDWPADSEVKNPKRKGRPRRTRESIFQAAELALTSGTKWREFVRSTHPDRILDQEELESLKARFDANERSSNGTLDS
jgi:DNA polymerase family B